MKKESKQSNLVRNDDKKVLQVEMVSKMKVNDLSLAEINFNGMSVENIIYIIENNKNGGTLDNNLSKNYIIELAKQNIELAKCLLINLKFNKDFIFLLNIVLENDPVFEVPISFEVSEDLRIQIIECYLKVGNYAFVSKYMEMVLSNLLMESYRFEENKTILDKILENNIKLTDNCYNYLLKNPVALITLVKYNSYLTQISNNDKYNMIFYDTLKVKENMKMLYNFIKENFSKYKDNLYIHDLAKNSDDIAKLFIDNGVFIPFVNQPFRKIFDNNTILDYILIKKNNGERIDKALEYFNNNFIGMYHNSYNLGYKEQKKLLEYIKIYCNYKYFDPFTKINDDCVIYLSGGIRFDWLEYILNIDPKFEGSKKDVSIFCLQHYMRVENWDFVSEVMHGSVYYNFDNLFENCYYDDSKMVIEVLIENNIKLDDDACNRFIAFVTENIPDNLKTKRIEKLLSKNESGLSLFERILMSQERFLNDLKSKLTKYKIYNGLMPPQFLRILVKFGLPINTSEEDSYSKEFYDNVQKYIFNLDYKEHQYPTIFTQEQLELIEKFIKMYEKDSDSNLIRMVLNNFYKWVISQPEQAIVYLENFIIIKNAFPNFVLKHKEYCQEISGGFLKDQICSIYDYSVFNHEFGHAIHYFAANDECPKHIQTLIEKFKSDPNTPSRIQAYASSKREMLEDYFHWIWKNDFYSYINEVYPGGKDAYENTIREVYQKNIANPDKIFADVVMRRGLKYLTPENISGDVPVDWKTYHRVTLENDAIEFWKVFSIFKFRSIFELEGLIDALFEGKWLENKIDGVTEKCYMGHSVAYFQLDSSKSFQEVYAFFSSLITTSSFEQDEVVKDLRFVLGDELYEALFEYYKDLNKTK